MTQAKNKIDLPKELFPHASRQNEEGLDEVYAHFAHNNPFKAVTHFIDHSTLAPEALMGLGLGHRVSEWTSLQKLRPYRAPVQGADIENDWVNALGKKECHGDWLIYFEKKLEVLHYTDILRKWVPRFAHQPNVFLFHGLIRTAHACRALDHLDTAVRRQELARGLALWAIGITKPGRIIKGPNVPSVSEEVLKLAHAGTVAFLGEPTVPNLHLVTSVMMYLAISHHLENDCHRLALHAFKRTHALALENEEHDLKALGETDREPESERVAIEYGTKDLENLLHIKDAHPAKMTEAVLRAYTHTGDVLYLKAAKAVQVFPTFTGAIETLREGFKSKLGLPSQFTRV